MPAKKVSKKSNVSKTTKKQSSNKSNKTRLIVFLAIFAVLGSVLAYSAFASSSASSESRSVSKDPNTLCRRYFTRKPNSDDFETVMSRLPVLRQGSSGTCVRTLQQQLGFKGYRVSVDGAFGSGTQSTVKQFQRSRGLTQDGVVGRATWDALYR